jgi:prepilin-type N-terminal cleavage/methylation domain-containing protein
MKTTQKLMGTGSRRGFTLIEVLIVLVIIGILAGLAIPRYVGATSKAKQVEAKQLLRQIYTMEQSHRLEHDAYWIPPGGVKASRANPRAFALIGIEIMAQARYEYDIRGNADHFIATATANLDDDPAIDTWTIDETGELKGITDDTID